MRDRLINLPIPLRFGDNRHELGGNAMIEVAFRQEGFATASAALPIADLDSVADDTRGIFVRRAAHQDWRSVQGSLDGATFWLPLYEIGPDDYPLEVIAGSN